MKRYAMRSRRTHLLVPGLFLALAPLAAAQVPGTPPPAPGSDGTAAEAAVKLVPGVLPEGTSAEARAAWERFTGAMSAGRHVEGGVRSFDIAFDVTRRDGAQSNDFDMRVRYLAPSWCSMQMGKRVLAQGPEGAWLSDPKAKETIALVGREYEQDREHLQETLTVARNFVSLLDPTSLRIAALRRLPEPPAGVPAELGVERLGTVTRAAALEWIELDTPDFRVLPRSSEPRVAPLGYRVALGLDPKTGRPHLARVHEIGDALRERRTALLVALPARAYADVREGYAIPYTLHVYEPDRERAFAPAPLPDLELTIRGPRGFDLNPRDVTRETFLPPR